MKATSCTISGAHLLPDSGTWPYSLIPPHQDPAKSLGTALCPALRAVPLLPQAVIDQDTVMAGHTIHYGGTKSLQALSMGDSTPEREKQF